LTVIRAIARPAAQLFGGRSGSIVIALLAALLLLAVVHPTYYSLENLRVILLNSSSVGIAAVAMALLLIAGKVDLSVGAIFAAGATAGAWLGTTLPAPLAIAAGVGVGALLGLVNGLLVQRIRVSPIIVTLGTLTVIRGLLQALTQGRGIRGVQPDFADFGRATPFGVPTQIWIMLGLVVLGQILLSRTTVGQHVFAIGGNAEAANIAGVNVRKIVLGLFAFSGALAALAGVLTASRFGTATSTFGVGFELDVITAVILGGVAFSGGEGSIGGALVAVIFLGVVNSGLISIGVDPFWTDVVKGGALVISVAIEQLTQERRERYRKAVAMAEQAARLKDQRSQALGISSEE
jgi:ribose/xylose/arabinose/galactoside ABC-type transport system permease subunit